VNRLSFPQPIDTCEMISSFYRFMRLDEENHVYARAKHL
jgi:hypothetical protein